jgi:hypothetical protein
MAPDEAPGLKDDPAKTQAVVEEVQAQPKQVKKEIKLDQALIMSEVQLLLADKRTSYALLRTGVSVSLVPMSIWTVLVATSKLYDPFSALWLLVPVMLIAGALFLLGSYLIIHALQHIAHIERTMGALRQSATFLEQLLYKHNRWHF